MPFTRTPSQGFDHGRRIASGKRGDDPEWFPDMIGRLDG